jgi:biotin carboxyl carrier protein
VDPVFIKGVLAFVTMMVVFVGSAWLLLSMILGVRLGYFVMASCLFGVLVLISAIWFVTGLGPKADTGFLGSLGEETNWHPIAVGPTLTTVDTDFGRFNFGDYPRGEWEKPSERRKMADIPSTASEVSSAKPVMEELVNQSVSEIPGIREGAKTKIQGEVKLIEDEFEITDVMMKQNTVAGKDSVVAVGKAVPTSEVNSGTLNNQSDGEVAKLLVKTGAQVSAGQPLMTVNTPGGPFDLTSDKPGRLVEFAFRIDDKIKPNVPFASIDISGQPGVPTPVEVSAVRVRGSEKVPAFIYLVTFTLLFAVHLRGLSRTEKALKSQPQPA